MHEWLDGWMDGWKDGWMDGWMDGWTDGWMDACIYHLCCLHVVYGAYIYFCSRHGPYSPNTIAPGGSLSVVWHECSGFFQCHLIRSKQYKCPPSSSVVVYTHLFGTKLQVRALLNIVVATWSWKVVPFHFGNMFLFLKRFSFGGWGVDGWMDGWMDGFMN